MTTNHKTVLVLGATGQQGGAVAAHLLADGWQVRAFTRDPSSKAAHSLAQAGAQIVQGDMGDRTSLDAAMQGVYGVFSVQPPTWEPSDARTAEEIRWGKNAADAAKDAGVQHFVYSSNSGADVQSRFRYFAKWEIEQYIHTLGLQATILRPSGFMESYGYEVDFPTLRSLHPGLMDFDTWLEKKGKAMFEVLFQTNQTN